jgi:hypothetical protein
LQTFRGGQGDIVFNGDLPGVRYWENSNKDYRAIFILERDSKGYVGVTLQDIKTPQDLKGKTIATRVGSTGSWFISEYLTKSGLGTSDVTIKNLDTQILPTALCKGGHRRVFHLAAIRRPGNWDLPDANPLPYDQRGLHPRLYRGRRASGMVDHPRWKGQGASLHAPRR